MTHKKKYKEILNKLIERFPDAKIELNYNKSDPWQLLVVVALSAQTTDKKVNEVSPELFKKFPDIKAFAQATAAQIEPFIKYLGLYKNKAKNLVLAAQKILAEFDGKVPKNRSLLQTIPGVGPKTAAVIIANAFDTPAIAVDTHVARISQRLGLTKHKDPNKIEADLCHIWPKEMWLKAHHTLIIHGRNICFARKPLCNLCPVNELCPKIGVKPTP